MMAEPLPHGGRLEAAMRRYPDAPRPFVDLSTGINPIGYPIPKLPETCFTRLPEPEALERLQASAARAYNAADQACVAAAPGTQALINLLPRLRPPGTAAVLSPTYAEHAAAWSAAGHRVREATSAADLDAADCAVLCNPNNPDGRRIPTDTLRALATRLAARGGWLVVDEAFADLEPDFESLAGCLPHPGLVVLRSFGKTYGLAGIRLGFALADAPRAAAIRAALGPWPVSGIAIEIGCAALPDAAWRSAAQARLRYDAARLDALLTHPGCNVLGGTILFRLCDDPDGPARAERLAQAGILVRSFQHRRGWLRFGIPGEPDHWQRLEAALR